MPWLCAGPECKKQPYYALNGERPKFCFLHKLPTHIDVRNKRCEVENCEVRPHYGYDGEAPRFCANHKAEGMHNLRSRRCKAEGCLKYASCGEPGGTPDFCTGHKLDGMMNLIGRRCFNEDCETYASYGNVGMRPRFCAKHKDPSMINLTVKKCEIDGCMTQPSFNYQGQRKARFCAKHRQETMIDVLDRHCAEPGCDRQPIYGNSHEQTGRPLWCPSHRPESSFDVKTSRCQELNCLKHPSYGLDSDRIRRRCRLHKLPNMVDVKSPRCETPGCKKQPCCGHLGAKARFCSEHKQEGMVNLKTRAFRCKHKASDFSLGMMPQPSVRSTVCNRACRFAYPNDPAVYCARHKLEGMVDVLNPQCSMQDCMEIPTHGYDGEQPTFCMAHMATGMKVIVAQSPNILHWSAEARKQAAATARESSRLLLEREAGSAKCTPLPPKTDAEARRRMQEAHADVARAAAAVKAMEGLSASTSPIPIPHEELNSNITAAELALAFGSDSAPMDDSSHVVTSSAGPVTTQATPAPAALPTGACAVPAITNNGTNPPIVGIGGVAGSGAATSVGNLGNFVGMGVLGGYASVAGAPAGVTASLGHAGVGTVSAVGGVGANGSSMGPGIVVPNTPLGYFSMPLPTNPFPSAFVPPPLPPPPPPPPQQQQQSQQDHGHGHGQQQAHEHKLHQQLEALPVAASPPPAPAAAAFAVVPVNSSPLQSPGNAPTYPSDSGLLIGGAPHLLALPGPEANQANEMLDSGPAKKRRRSLEPEDAVPLVTSAAEGHAAAGANLCVAWRGLLCSSSIDVQSPMSMPMPTSALALMTPTSSLPSSVASTSSALAQGGAERASTTAVASTPAPVPTSGQSPMMSTAPSSAALTDVAYDQGLVPVPSSLTPQVHQSIVEQAAPPQMQSHHHQSQSPSGIESRSQNSSPVPPLARHVIAPADAAETMAVLAAQPPLISQSQPPSTFSASHRSPPAANEIGPSNGWDALLGASTPLALKETPQRAPHGSNPCVGEGDPGLAGTEARATPAVSGISGAPMPPAEQVAAPAMGNSGGDVAGGPAEGDMATVPATTVEPMPQPVAQSAEDVSMTEALHSAPCTARSCSSGATFGHPGLGRMPTHCLTHCEEGMHRLVDDNVGRCSSSLQSTKGVNRKMPLVATETEAMTNRDGLGQGKRVKKATANASEGILLLAGAVASHSMEGLDDADDQESAST